MMEIKAIIQPFMLESVLNALAAIEDLPGLTVSQVEGWGRSRLADSEQAVEEAGHAFAKKTKIEIVVPGSLSNRVVEAIVKSARTGQPGDGKVFVHEVSRAIRIRTGDEGPAAV